MRRLNRTVLFSAIAGMLVLFMVQAVQAGWFWNAQLDVAGTDTRLVWQVDDEDGQNDYRATIVLRHPKGADVSLVSTMTDLEKVRLAASKRLVVTEAGVQVEATFRVTALKGANGGTVTVSIMAPGYGTTLATAEGSLGQKIVLTATVPVGDSDDDAGEDDD
jgi:hypothetical protein